MASPSTNDRSFFRNIRGIVDRTRSEETERKIRENSFLVPSPNPSIADGGMSFEPEPRLVRLLATPRCRNLFERERENKKKQKTQRNARSNHPTTDETKSMAPKAISYLLLLYSIATKMPNPNPPNKNDHPCTDARDGCQINTDDYRAPDRRTGGVGNPPFVGDSVRSRTDVDDFGSDPRRRRQIGFAME